MSPGRSPVDWKGSRKENLHVDDEGKLLLRCAERDAKRASSVLMWELVISRNETKESHVSLETLLGEEIDLVEVGGCLAQDEGTVMAPRKWREHLGGCRPCRR